MLSRSSTAFLLTCVCVSTSSSLLYASEPAGWQGSVDAGYTAIAGNSNSSTLIGNARTRKVAGKLTHHLEAGAKNSEEATLRTAESYRVAGKEDIAFSPRDYLFIHSAWSKDRFSGYDWQLSAAAGYGRKLIDEPTRRLSFETGPGFRHDDLPSGDTEDSGLWRIAASFEQQITTSTTLRQVLEADLGEDNTTTHSLSELAVKMSDRLQLKAALDLKRNSKPPTGSRNTDRTTTVSIAWNF